MSVCVNVYGPAEAEKHMGGWGRKRNCVNISDDESEHDPIFQEIMDWVLENDIKCIMMPAFDQGVLFSISLLFAAHDLDESNVQRINDDYMRFKLTYKGHERITQWHDDYQKCTVGWPM